MQFVCKSTELKDMGIGMLCIIKIVGNNLRKQINPKVIAYYLYSTQPCGCMGGCILDLISLACQFAHVGFYDRGCQRRLTGTMGLTNHCNSHSLYNLILTFTLQIITWPLHPQTRRKVLHI